MTKHIRHTRDSQLQTICKIGIFAFVFSIQRANWYSCEWLSESKNVPYRNISSTRGLPFDDSFELFDQDEVDAYNKIFFRSRSKDYSEMYDGEFQEIDGM